MIATNTVVSRKHGSRLLHNIGLFFVFVFFQFAYSQVEQEIRGTVLDETTGLPIPFVNIGILAESIGTVSNENGNFHLIFEKNIPSDAIVQISSIGYSTKKFDLAKLTGSGFTKIYLQPDITVLNEVVVSSERSSKLERVGYLYDSNLKLGYWKGNGSLGGELVTKIKVNKQPRTLNQFHFLVKGNTSDSLLMRVNVYEGNSMVPEKKLNRSNIFHTIKVKEGEEVVDLRSHGIFVQDDFMIGLELLKVYGGGEIGLVLAATSTPGTSYRRYASQGEWERFRGDAMTFSVETSVLLQVDDVSTLRKEKTLAALDHSIDNTNPLEHLTKVNASVFKEITGFVFHEGEPVSNVAVQVAGMGKSTITDAYGRYVIMAKVGDKINYSFLGMEPETKEVEESTTILNISLLPKANQLENVVVTANKRLKRTEKQKFEDYNIDKGLMKSAFGTLDKETAGVNMQVVDFSDRTATAVNLKLLLQQSFSGVQVVDDNYISGAQSVIYLRGRTSILNEQPAIYEVDGQIFTQIPDMINVADIQRIAKLPGMAAVRKYGSIAAGGLFIINTRNSNFSPRAGTLQQDPLVRTDNAYKSDALTKSEYDKSLPGYLSDLNSAPSFDTAVKIYGEYKKMYGTFPYFYLDALDYFMKNWKDEGITLKILEDGNAVLESEAKLRRALAYVFERNGKMQKAVPLHKQNYKEYPNASQSYMSLARSYLDNKEYAKAAGIYSRYMYLLEKNFLTPDTNVTHEVIATDFDNLLKQHGDELQLEMPLDVNAEKNVDRKIRIVFEWNDPSANFVLQFVDKDQRFFTWDNWEESNLGQNIAYLGSKQFEILREDAMFKPWLVNVKYRGNKDLTPTYIKATIFFDFGLPTETQEVQLFRLGLKDVNHELFKVSASEVQ
ncbi:carboxypeptidase-like regulatory domain-containing protein [Flagellimonas beolgyonensis]|uniref:carboxypeptidase-like regulatory domain-containing protein n=1 Tax=Flagellimonas beolgyonensis TaxID=864064 RepID=UPI000F8CFFC6|nr:carboxypeptidase-like regulatory domain-containing protein [Allomuricauda beolgyonensis]